MILVTAVPFGDAVLGTGALVGISPYLLLQWIVPVATETPELVVAFVLLTARPRRPEHRRAARGRGQPVHARARHAAAGLRRRRRLGPLPLAGRERIELLLTVGVALYAVAALVTLRLSRGDSSIMLVLFAGQLLIPTVFTRFVFAVVFWAVAIDVLVSERRAAAGRCSALRPRAAAPSAQRRGRSPTRPFAYAVTS